LDTEVLIVGAGLSGLSAAWRLKQLGIEYRLVEARARTGGRILSSAEHGDDYDLGPSWIWPGQPQVEQLLSELGLSKFSQPVEGTTLYQLQNGQIQQYQGLSPMAGAFRIKGGSAALTNALTNALISERNIYTEHVCTHVSASEDGVQVTIKNDQLQQALQQLPTWMAAHAKAVAIFDKPFWQEQGLSGTAMSQVGPLVEIHNASPYENGPYALFGFVGYPASARKQIGQSELIKLVEQQLVSIFGPAASNPIDVILQDWSTEPFTADAKDLDAPNGHPAYGLSIEATGEWDTRLQFISTETNYNNGGLIEGAIDRANRFVEQYSSQR